MKKQLFIPVILFLLLIVSCRPEKDGPDTPSVSNQGCYIVNYGSFGNGGASISKYDYTKNELTNLYYKQQNNGQDLLSNIQHAGFYNDSVYFVGNSPDQLITLNKLMKQTRNGVTEQLAKPRYFVGHGDYLYISCWGPNPDWATMADSYIAVFNLKTNSVDTKIALPGGPEGLEIAHDKLFVALNFKDSIAVVHLSDKAISYIKTPAVTSRFVKDKNDNLYVSMVSTYSNSSDSAGIGFINTANESLSETFLLANVSSGYGSIMQPNGDFTKIFIITSAYDDQFNLTGAVSVFNVNSGLFDEQPFVDNVAGISCLGFNTVNNQLYVCTAPNATGPGSLKTYTEDGTFQKEYGVGISPSDMFFLD
ncbi:MAG: hypothetical protein CSA36_03160 [Draconibacterium sp.]|nr:MAG: hypothetical protein CSA36_03160 [Draconibacterium sp.]